MGRIHISEAEAARDFALLMARVRAGAEFVIEDGTLPVAVIHTPDPPRRTLSTCIAMARSRETTGADSPVLDADFASDVEEIVRNRKPWSPPAWE